VKKKDEIDIGNEQKCPYCGSLNTEMGFDVEPIIDIEINEIILPFYCDKCECDFQIHYKLKFIDKLIVNEGDIDDEICKGIEDALKDKDK